MSDNIDGIFDDLNPDDFHRETSAIDTLLTSAGDYDSFDAFVDEQVRALRQAYFAATGRVDPLAILVSATETLVFLADDDETLGAWLDRVHREAQRVGAIWTFVSKKTLVGSRSNGGATPPTIDVNDQEEVEQAIAEGLLTLGMCWYAETHDKHTPRRHRFGQMPEVFTGRLGDCMETTTQPVPLFAKILDD